MNKAYKYRIYPNEIQQQFFQQTFSATRFVWNKMLYDKIEHFKETGKTITLTPKRYKEDNIWLKDVDSLALANVQLQLQTAYSAFFNEKKHKFTDKTITKAKRQGRTLTFYDFEKHPKFKSKKDNNWMSYTTNNQNGTVMRVGNYIKLPKVGLIKCKFHRDIPSDATIKSATVSQASTGKYFVSVLAEFERDVVPKFPETFLGLDFSMKELYVDNDNNFPEFSRYYRQAEKNLAKEQRKLSHMEKNSNNYYKQKRKITKRHEKVANQRKDFLHKQSNLITKSYDAVCIEDLNMKAMAQGLNFGKSVADNGWGMFTNFLKYKQEWNGGYLVKIDKWYPSSKMCHVCGCINDDLTLADREWDCEGCGTHHLRDHNAAINIRNEGMRVLAAKLSVA